MKDNYLEVTFRHGRPIAAYYYLPREAGQKAARTRRVEPGLIVDLTADGKAIGIEITAPSKVSLEALNAVLETLGHPPASKADLAPVHAAQNTLCQPTHGRTGFPPSPTLRPSAASDNLRRSARGPTHATTRPPLRPHRPRGHRHRRLTGTG